jgi:hypothetical protein
LPSSDVYILNAERTLYWHPFLQINESNSNKYDRRAVVKSINVGTCGKILKEETRGMCPGNECKFRLYTVVWRIKLRQFCCLVALTFVWCCLASPPLLPIMSHIKPIQITPKTIALRPILILSTHRHLGLRSGVFHYGFPTNVLHALLSICATYLAFLSSKTWSV